MSPNFLIPEISVAEKILRPIVVYIFLLIAFRIVGKRELASMTPFDLIILLTIANVLQNAMIGPDNSLTGGLIGATAMFAANSIIAQLSYHVPGFERFVVGQPTSLIQNGRILKQNLERELLTLDDLKQALRKNMVDLDADLADLRRVALEADGSITITRFTDSELGNREQRRGRVKRRT